MNDKPAFDDQAIRALLEKRAGQPDVAGRLAMARSAAAATPQRRGNRVWLAVVRSPALAVAGGLALLVVIVAASLFAGGGRLGGTGTASGEPTTPPRSPQASTASPSASPTVAAFGTSVLPLTVDQLNAVLGSYSLVGRQLVITGSIQVPVISSHPVCCSSGPPSQPAAILVGSTPLLQVESAGPASLADPFPFTGTFAATLIDPTTLQFEGIVMTAADGSPIVPTQLPRTWNATGTHPYWLVQGWIAGFDVAVPCAPVSAQPAGPQYYGCGVTSSLSDTAAQPVSGTSFNVPKDGVQVQDRAYDDFVPDPHLAGPGTVPELATFLVDQTLGPCPPSIYCSFGSGLHWHIVTRIDPWPVSAQP